MFSRIVIVKHSEISKEKNTGETFKFSEKASLINIYIKFIFLII